MPGRSTRSAFEASPLRTPVISVKSCPLSGDINFHSKMSGRPPPPKDWTPDKVRFPQLESVSGPSRKAKARLWLVNEKKI